MTDNTERYSHGHPRIRAAQPPVAHRAELGGLRLAVPQRRHGVARCGLRPRNITADLAGLISGGEVVGVDLPADVIATAQREFGGDNLRFEVGDVYGLHFEEGSFDLVYGHQVLQHIGEPVAALREMLRVLRPGGHVAVRDSDYGALGLQSLTVSDRPRLSHP